MIEFEFENELAEEVWRDFSRRREERRALERSWQLNMNFVGGNQYCDLDERGEIVEENKKYSWQYRRVFNHIASILDTRLAKLSRVRPALSVRAASDNEDDRHSARLASAILAAVQDDCDMDGVISQATIWSETCGTAFYKVMWDAAKGRAVGFSEDGKKLKAGDVDIVAVSPFEIYPASLSVEKLSEQPSLIHAKAVPVEDIFTMYGVQLVGRDIDEFSLSPYIQNCNSPLTMPDLTGVKHNYEIVIERYIRPTEALPDGRLTVIAGGRILYDGALPYLNGDEEARVYPFVKQTAVPSPGAFFGKSVIDRLIPVQRAFNAVKNRKHEFLNRISMGTVAVEDGSLDIDELAEDGLVPGKILVYNHGSTPPEMLQLGSVPSEFWQEETSLLQEFTKISGTGDLTENADSFSGITSATGLQLIIEQDDSRLAVAYGEIKRAMRNIGRQILRLYRQFAGDARLAKFAGENGSLEIYYFKGSDVSSDDVTLEADSDLNMTAAQKRTVIYELMDRGLFAGEDGKMSASVRNKLLELLGYGSLAGERDLGELNRTRAGSENLAMKKGDVGIKPYDDHATHIAEHKAYLISENPDAECEARIMAHLALHESALKEKGEKDGQAD